MTTNHHTPIANGAAADSATINNPLSELDTKLTDHETRIGVLENEFPAASGNPTEYLDGDGNWTVPAGTGASVDGHLIKDEGVALPQRASIDFVGAGVAVTNEAGGTQVSIPGSSAVLESVVAGTNVTVDDTDPANPIISVSSSGLTISSASVTTSNVTGAEGTLHNLDVSGMTANRDFNLPTPSEAGKRVGVRLSAGDATYALLLKINAVEWSRIFITNEIVIFVSTGTGAADWVVELNGKIKQVGKMWSTVPQTLSTATYTLLTMNAEVFDTGDIVDISTEKITVRRSGRYRIDGCFSIAVIDGKRAYVAIEKNDVNVAFCAQHGSVSNTISPETSRFIDASAGDYFELYGYQDTGSNQDTIAAGASTYPSLSIEEVL